MHSNIAYGLIGQSHSCCGPVDSGLLRLERKNTRNYIFICQPFKKRILLAQVRLLCCSGACHYDKLARRVSEANLSRSPGRSPKSGGQAFHQDAKICLVYMHAEIRRAGNSLCSTKSASLGELRGEHVTVARDGGLGLLPLLLLLELLPLNSLLQVDPHFRTSADTA